MSLIQIEIEYCVECNWLMRAGWFGQELLETFSRDIAGLTLVPGRGGIFEIRMGGELLFSRAQENRFPDSTEIKRMLRSKIECASNQFWPDRVVAKDVVPIAAGGAQG